VSIENLLIKMRADSLGQRLRQAREAANLTQAQAAQQIGRSRSLICAWETDKNKPTKDDVRAMEQLYNINLSPPPRDTVKRQRAAKDNDPQSRVIKMLEKILQCLNRIEAKLPNQAKDDDGAEGWAREIALLQANKRAAAKAAIKTSATTISVRKIGMYDALEAQNARRAQGILTAGRSK
jgi:transcriptional regulator with XRE-family HTH domain